MTDSTDVYVEVYPGELITAEIWNDMQRHIAADIRTTASDAAHGVTHVETADDAKAVDGRDVDALTDEITRRVLEAVQTETGYRKVFRVLEGDDDVDVIEHGLGNFPLVDVYELLYFPVACREDDATRRMLTTFYLHHSSERRVRVTLPDGSTEAVDIQPDGLPVMGIPFGDMLAQYDVEYTDGNSLEDLEVEFWKAFFAAPNDRFHDDQYCHSPWFERCCRDQRTVGEIRDRGDWDDIWFQVRPLKIVGGPVRQVDGDDDPDATQVEPSAPPTPANVAVLHLDLDRVAVALTGRPFHTRLFLGQDEDGNREELPEEFRDELKVMVLLHA